jgi:hypothetical protein
MGLRRTAIAAALALLGIAGVAPRPGGAQSGETPRSCGWEARLDPTVLNTLYPDQAANYWTLALPAVPGASLTIRGLYPHSRYISFTSYDVALRAVDGLNDQRIDPDPGPPPSRNPFLPGAARNTPDQLRHYTVRVVFGQRTSDVHNVLYTTNQQGDLSAQYFLVVYRVYRVDRTYALRNDITGGVRLPSVTYNAPGGVSERLPSCPYPVVPANGVNQDIANAGSASSTPLLAFPGTNPPTYHKFFNQPTSTVEGATDNGYTGTTIGDTVSPLTMQLPRGGFLQNLDNAYVFAQLTHGYGNIAVVHARLPSFPQTFADVPTMGTGQLRYWSLCSNDGPSQRYYGCLPDDQLVLDSSGDYTIVVSTAAARPATATAACGVNWLPWGPNSAVLLIMRNMLPEASFTQSIQAAGFNSVQHDMGPYYPSTVYTATASFHAPLCP